MPAICPECDSPIDVDEFDVDIGDELTCSECGSFLRVASDSPLEFELADEVVLDEEEVEYTLSLIAAEDAVELLGSAVGTACVLALEVPESIIEAEHELSISLSAPLQWDYVQCCFEVSADGQELTWFATQEIASNLATWLS